MYVITNRRLDKNKGDLRIFSKEPNERGPNELRLVKVTKSGSAYKATLLDNELPPAVVKKINDKLKLNLDTSVKWYQRL